MERVWAILPDSTQRRLIFPRNQINIFLTFMTKRPLLKGIARSPHLF